MTHTVEEIKEAVEQHQIYLAYQTWEKADPETRGEEPPKGIRFALKDLRWADLRVANLTGADLTNAYLRGANLLWANLTEADLTNAHLWEADLRWVTLRGADLRGADLRWAIGNGREVKSIQTDKHHITWTNTDLAIGCQQHPLADWLAFSDDEKYEFSDDAVEYLNKWLPILDSMGVFDRVKRKETE